MVLCFNRTIKYDSCKQVFNILLLQNTSAWMWACFQERVINDVIEMVEIHYIDKSIGTHNHWIQVFHSGPLPQVYKIMHLTMQSAFTHISERMGHSKELKCGTVVGCYCCNKLVCGISLLDIPPSIVSGITGTTATQPQSARPRRVTEQVVECWGA